MSGGGTAGGGTAHRGASTWRQLAIPRALRRPSDTDLVAQTRLATALLYLNWVYIVTVIWSFIYEASAECIWREDLIR